MITKIQKWGNSQGIRFSKEVLEAAHVSIGDEVDVLVSGGEIVVKPVSVKRGKYKIKELLSSMPRNYKAEEVDWGGASGGEVW